ncbi:unnamed protein product [Penicillium salamii]|uniref:Uncharacterized protein n=1 Tax=Penicillium salamii TaxID=1612424 RepID=A0A9W4JXP8_9EURO|nr:unnamed protein product [Penicillium salamii]CAG7950295.1 unnamed protein product [Penicillium salamii]CAG7988780.1 unnamed protein product [Penicillium salamii]CAG8157300.1 unnamed protein product [Penicillium salamii]CAG8256548.1 unnamed protein product [Penicillium salamii]
MTEKMGSKKISFPATKSALVPFRSADNMTTALSRASQIDDPIETTYVRMLKEEAEMDISFNITVGVANWALLAGYLVIPGTFTSLQTSNQVEKLLQVNKAGLIVLHTIQNPPLLAIACFLLGKWLINKLFVPLSLNAAAGLLTTVINVCTSQGGDWSVMAIVTTAVTGATLSTCSALLAIYKFYKLEQIIKEDEYTKRSLAAISK